MAVGERGDLATQPSAENAAQLLVTTENAADTDMALEAGSDPAMRQFAGNLDHFLVTTEDVAGIETVIDRIDVYISFLQDAHLDRNCTEFLFPDPRQQHRANRMLSVAKELRNLLLRRLYIEYSRKLSTPPPAARALKMFYGRLARRWCDKHEMHVFTTNYDVALEELSENVLDLDKEADAATSCIAIEGQRMQLTHLHGCVAWRYVDNVTAPPDEQPVDMNPTPALIEKYDRMVVKTGTARAARKLDRSPFNQAYRVFERILWGCRVLIVLGVGFRDRDLVRDIARSLDDRDDFSLLVVDKALRKGEVVRRLKSHGGRKDDWNRQVHVISGGVEEEDSQGRVFDKLDQIFNCRLSTIDT